MLRTMSSKSLHILLNVYMVVWGLMGVAMKIGHSIRRAKVCT